MSRYISDSVRKLVFERAGNRCEYCLSYTHLSFFSFHIEHIVSIKHGGKTTLNNLALSCPICNLNKGSDLGTFLYDPNILTRFFNPRTDIWKEHFQITNYGFIEPIIRRCQSNYKNPQPQPS